MLVHKEVEFYFKMITFYEEHSDYNEQAAKKPKNKSASRQINVPSASAKLAFDYKLQRARKETEPDRSPEFTQNTNIREKPNGCTRLLIKKHSSIHPSIDQQKDVISPMCPALGPPSSGT